MKYALITSVLFSTLAATDQAAAVPQNHQQIRSLSAGDIHAIREGQGWNLAKPAELNGYPGPRHVLDLAEELHLDPDQQQQMERLFSRMKARAITLGEQYLEAERRLEEAFRQQRVNPDSLQALVEASAKAHSTLRYHHLSTHLEAIKLLSSHQVARYNELQGYGSASPHEH